MNQKWNWNTDFWRVRNKLSENDVICVCIFILVSWVELTLVSICPLFKQFELGSDTSWWRFGFLKLGFSSHHYLDTQKSNFRQYLVRHYSLNETFVQTCKRERVAFVVCWCLPLKCMVSRVDTETSQVVKKLGKSIWWMWRRVENIKSCCLLWCW